MTVVHILSPTPSVLGRQTICGSATHLDESYDGLDAAYREHVEGPYNGDPICRDCVKTALFTLHCEDLL